MFYTSARPYRRIKQNVDRYPASTDANRLRAPQTFADVARLPGLPADGGRDRVRRSYRPRGIGERTVSGLPGAQRVARRIPGAGARAGQSCSERRLDTQRILSAERLATRAAVTPCSFSRCPA